MIRFFSLLVLILFFASFQLLVSQTLTLESGQVRFTGSVPLHDFTGESDSLRGSFNLSDKRFRFSLPLETLDTGIGRRDRKMYEILNTDDYPEVLFEGSIVELPDSTFQDSQKVVVDGKVTLNGRTKPKSLTGIVKREGNGIRIEANFNFDYTKYGVERPGFLFYKVNEEIEIRIWALLR